MRTPMDKPSDNLSREERLVAKLRENLHRRKAQAREKGADETAALPKSALKS